MTLEPKIDKKTAEADINRWLDLKKIPTATREAKQASFNRLVTAVMHDGISIDEKGIITHKLNFPIDGEGGTIVCESFTYKLRLTVNEIEACMSAGGDVKIYGAALTINSSVPSSYFGRIDTTDLSILEAITVFFTC